MDIEHLSKSQIVLLTLLVSFITSIATGIVTVSLMEQAPPSIAQNVNRIVERTVERVVPSGQAASTVITQERTVVVKEEELISQAIEKAAPSIVRIYLNDSETAAFIGLGTVVNSTGTIATDIDAVLGIVDAVVQLPDGSRVSSDVMARDKDSGIALLSAATTTTDNREIAWKPAAISSGNFRLGQTVIAIAGESTNRIAYGLISALEKESSADSMRIIGTNIPGDSIMPGGVFINVDGDVIGISTSVSRMFSLSSFINASVLTKKPEAPKETTEKTE
ncbi:MAG TPA: serine protease [Candidatus Paceibacterota bacterium]